MMMGRRLAGGLLAAGTAAGMLSAGAVPAQAAGTAAPAQAARMELQAGLHGSSAYPRAGGHGSYESSSRRELHVQVQNIQRLGGRTLVVYVHGTKAGTMRVSRSGSAYLNRDRGVPACRAGQSLRVRTGSGTLVASGTFSRHHMMSGASSR
ncbi:MAG TPA: hypothetical protein VMV92_43625 [Streptosporangiaceae bacterium]|nr:hypothetical protein [Streptosporangiaceae bacterium]